MTQPAFPFAESDHRARDPFRPSAGVPRKIASATKDSPDIESAGCGGRTLRGRLSRLKRLGEAARRCEAGFRVVGCSTPSVPGLLESRLCDISAAWVDRGDRSEQHTQPPGRNLLAARAAPSARHTVPDRRRPPPLRTDPDHGEEQRFHCDPAVTVARHLRHPIVSAGAGWVRSCKSWTESSTSPLGADRGQRLTAAAKAEVRRSLELAPDTERGGGLR
jgi:hypothetical protein